jgi:hypothetical protein
MQMRGVFWGPLLAMIATAAVADDVSISANTMSVTVQTADGPVEIMRAALLQGSCEGGNAPLPMNSLT